MKKSEQPPKPKKSFTGYIGKTKTVGQFIGIYFGGTVMTGDFISTKDISKSKGSYDVWGWKNWPPKKVRITIEEI